MRDERPTDSGNRRRKAANAPGNPMTGEGDKKSQLRKVKKTLIDLYDLLCYTVRKISRGIVSRII